MAVVVGGSSASAAPTTPGAFVSVPPTRLLDTRSGIGAPKAALGPLQSLVVQVGGRGGVPAAPAFSAVVLNVTVTAPTAGGYLTVWPSDDGTLRPAVSNLNFSRGQTVPNLVVTKVSANGRVSIFNGSGGTVQVLADVSGYYLAGSAQDPGMFAPLPPARLLDTRTGLGAQKAAVGAQHSITVQVTGRGGVPATGVSAVVLNVTVTAPTSGGYLTVYPGGARPTVSNLNFSAGQTVPNLVVAPVSSGGTVTIYNGSGGTVQVLADLSGYHLAGGPLLAGGLGPVPPLRLLDTRTGNGAPAAAVKPGATLSLHVNGRGWVLPTGVSAVVLNVTVTEPSSSGYITVWAGGTTRPAVSNLNFSRGQTVPNLVMAPVGSTGTVSFYNGSGGTVELLADVSGFVLSTSRAAAPQASTSHYVRNISDGGATDVATMHDEGCADAQANAGVGPYVTLLHIGAQSQHAPLSVAKPGVALTGFSEASTPRLTYPELVTALEGYLDGYVACRTGSASVRVAIGTNNDGDFTTYTATQKGTDWATQVIEPLRAHITGQTWLNVVGANDIEAGFASTEAQAEQWETAYLANTSADLIFTGSADACPTAFAPTVSTNCGAVLDDNGVSKTWSQADYIRLAYRLSPSRILAMPQIYVPAQAWQWADMAIASANGSDHVNVIGVLTEYAADETQFTSPQAWGAMWNALSASAGVTLPAPPTATDLRSDYPASASVTVSGAEPNATLPSG